MKRSLLFSMPFAIITWICFVISIQSCTKTAHSNTAGAVPFIHKTHVEKYGVKDCRTCHKYDEIGRFKGLPTIGECTACHDRNGEVANNYHLSPRKKTVFDSYTDKDKPWAFRVKNPDLVYYSHKNVMPEQSEDPLLKPRCESCHGDKARSSDIARVKGKPLMDQCIACHEGFGIVNKCQVCH